MPVVLAVVVECNRLVVISPFQSSSATISPVTPDAVALIIELDIVRVSVCIISGAQGIRTLACGRNTIPRVKTVIGPGIIFVSMEQCKGFGVVGIDKTDGPPEGPVIADRNADPNLVAANLLAQGKQDSMTITIPLTDIEPLGKTVWTQVEEEIEKLLRALLVLFIASCRYNVVQKFVLKQNLSLSAFSTILFEIGCG